MEIVIYHAYRSKEAQTHAVHPAFAVRSSGLLTRIAIFFALIGLLFLFVSYAPAFWFAVSSKGVEPASKMLVETAQHTIGSGIEQFSRNLDYQPNLDSSLPLESRLRIISIGIDTAVEEATYDNYERALRKGVWRVSDFGTPAARQKPLILAAHRFGYLSWSNSYRRQNSFYNLPQLSMGSIVEVDWQQRKYLYEVYGESRGDAIADYSADLILYTCEDLTGPVRIFKYAKLMII